MLNSGLVGLKLGFTVSLGFWAFCGDKLIVVGVREVYTYWVSELCGL